MSESAPADPVRVQVEETLHRVFDGVTAIPCAALRRMKRAADRSVDRVGVTLATPVGLIRSVFELALSGVLGGGTTSPSSTLRPESDRPTPTTTAAAAGQADAAPTVMLDGDPDDASTELPLHGYESLAASQVVARLSRLAPDELELIRAFEIGHRGRRTILGKIDQLLAGA